MVTSLLDIAAKTTTLETEKGEQTERGSNYPAVTNTPEHIARASLQRARLQFDNFKPK